MTPDESKPAAAGDVELTEGEDPRSVLRRIDRTLRDMRAAIDAQSRERQHREFSPLPMVGAAIQMAVIGLLILALLDWVFDWGVSRAYIKLVFAIALQLMALTAFVAAKRGG